MSSNLCSKAHQYLRAPGDLLRFFSRFNVILQCMHIAYLTLAIFITIDAIQSIMVAQFQFTIYPGIPLYLTQATDTVNAPPHTLMLPTPFLLAAAVTRRGMLGVRFMETNQQALQLIPVAFVDINIKFIQGRQAGSSRA